jgi:hypothetical protein
MKKMILSAAVAAFALSVGSVHADSLPVTVTKTKIPDGCEYKKVPGNKQKQLICVEDMNETDFGNNGVNVSRVTPETNTPEYRGQSGNIVGANNGKGNGDGDGIPGGSGKTKAANNDAQ